MVGDSISKLIVSLKNAGASKKTSVTVPQSSLSERVLSVLEREGFIKSFSKKGKKGGKETIDIELSYVNNSPRIHDARRVSRLSRRVYRGFRTLRSYKNGFGIRVVSTPKGVLSDKEARKERLGGEVLFEMW